MSYLVLARKFRPQTFADVVGQQPVVRTLQNALVQQRVAHAMLFSGVRGTGKTTLARIMAKALNCEQGPAAEPCNQCRSCREITGGTSVALQEVDGASNRGIQEIRELKENIRFMPADSRYKIILIDEVHMLTTEAFNALLKTLEEPPEHVYFMFATTEAHKVPVTILSRCQRYELKRLTHQELSAHFARLARDEQISMEPAAVEMIAREAAGSVRDGLSLLDQVFSYCGTEVRAVDVADILGLVGPQQIAALATAILAGDLAAIYTLLDGIYQQDVDIKRLGNDLLQWFRNLIVCKVSNHPEQALSLPDTELEQLKDLAQAHSLETMSAIFNLLLESLDRVALSRHPRLSMEMAFIRAVQFRDAMPLAELLTRFDELLSGLPVSDPISAPIPDRAPQSSAPRIPAPAQSPGPPPAPPPPVQEEAPQPEPSEPAGAEEPPVPPPAETMTATRSVPESAEPLLPIRERIQRDWPAFVQHVRNHQPWIAADLKEVVAVDWSDGELVLQFRDSTQCALLGQPDNLASLSENLLDFFEESMQIRLDAPEAEAGDPATDEQEERRALANDPLVLMARDIFTGQVGDIRTGARYRAGRPADAGQADNEEDEPVETEEEEPTETED
ncbi:MAG: DNA polymerase III subunit gamma/tau [Desulfobulbus sp.]